MLGCKVLKIYKIANSALTVFTLIASSTRRTKAAITFVSETT